MHGLQKERKKKEKNEKIKNKKNYQNVWGDFQNIRGLHICMYNTQPKGGGEEREGGVWVKRKDKNNNNK